MSDARLISSPSKKDKFTLRLMIIIGLIAMFFFISGLIKTSVIGNAWLYGLFITSIVFTCLKILHEWYHYYAIAVPEKPAGNKVFTVDIFTTFCKGEPYEMIIETLTAVKAITYPHTTYLCDEADDPYLKDLCRKLGVIHVTRVEKKNAKAGNINNALKQATGQLCVVLDPDHVPVPDFLDPIVAHFNNPEIGFVQIVQAYKNKDEGLIAKGAAQQTYQFYGPMMMTMNSYGTVQAIGANCTFRRAALDSIGGHAAGLAEDMHTAMQLHAKGWKSVYVPAVLARGLVPSTLSAYYSQQLKWSRGVFELLVSAYPRLFSKFTWRQKLYYFTVPLYYLSGLIFLINFLIPILSLTFSTSPVHMDIMHFAVSGLPFVAAIILIRHFVQWWVMDDDERGFHVVGGLLAIGTWWIFILGLFYTIIRKKVPYIPTPKDDTEENNWPLNIPNIAVTVLSVAAVVYGLYNDYNPYNIAMSGFALLNCFIMLFNILASRQQYVRKLRASFKAVDTSMSYIGEFKKEFWLLRRRIYTSIRNSALLITVSLTCLTLYLLSAKTDNTPGVIPTNKDSTFLFGIFAPQDTSGRSSVNSVLRMQRKHHMHFDMVSMYLAWGDSTKARFPEKEIDSVYQNGALPMITWEPWQNLFEAVTTQVPAEAVNKKVFLRITEGRYDQYLEEFAKKIKNLKRPVFIRFAHEADNPAYPWSATGGNTPAEFKAAWHYVHNYFEQQQVYNAIWVWNPWKADAVQAFFPGRQYVDWIGVTNLNYATDKWHTMQSLYAPFHASPVFRSGLPVMLAETGSLHAAGRQAEWFTKAFQAVKRQYPEIKAMVYFNSRFDYNVPGGNQTRVLDWTIKQPEHIARLMRLAGNKPLRPVIKLSFNARPTVAIPQKNTFFDSIKGVNYTKGQNWYRNSVQFRKKDLLKDFSQLNVLGVNTIKLYGPTLYDYNILNAANVYKLRIQYGFWIPDGINFAEDKARLNGLTQDILRAVEKLKNEQSIVSWNIGNTTFAGLKETCYKPRLLYQQQAYLAWLNTLTAAIKKADPNRPLSVEVAVSENLTAEINMFKSMVPAIDAYGLVLDKTSLGTEQIGRLKLPWFYSKTDVISYTKWRHTSKGVFAAAWQDEETPDWVTFNGLKDKRGRNKAEFYQYADLLKNRTNKLVPANVKILRPAKSTEPNSSLTYNALIYAANTWQFAGKSSKGFEFEWELVKSVNNKDVSVAKLGKGPSITFTMPTDVPAYKLYLYAVKNDTVTVISSTLNTPLKTY